MESKIPSPVLQPSGTPKRVYQPTGQLENAIQKIENCENLADECEKISKSMMRNAAGDASNIEKRFFIFLLFYYYDNFSWTEPVLQQKTGLTSWRIWKWISKLFSFTFWGKEDIFEPLYLIVEIRDVMRVWG